MEPLACTPAAGWQKGQVEKQVGVVRQRFFSPRLKFKSYAEVNAYLLTIGFQNRLTIGTR